MEVILKMIVNSDLTVSVMVNGKVVPEFANHPMIADALDAVFEKYPTLRVYTHEFTSSKISWKNWFYKTENEPQKYFYRDPAAPHGRLYDASFDRYELVEYDEAIKTSIALSA